MGNEAKRQGTGVDRERIAIYGAGGLGRLVLDILRQADRYAPAAFIDSNRGRYASTVDELPVFGPEHLDTLAANGVTGVIVAIGDGITRVSVAETLKNRGFALVSAIHPVVGIARSAAIGEHVIIGPRVSICVNATIGPHVVLSAGAIVEHDNRIGTGVFLQPAVRLAGGVTVGDFATFGIGACVIPGRTIGAGAMIDAGAVVISDIPAKSRATGVPAVATG